MICADTSFLLSYYGEDGNSERARRLRAATTQPLRIHALNDFEFVNALRLLVFRKKISAQRMAAWLEGFEADKNAGILFPTEIDANAAVRRAEILSVARTETGGNRSYDILQVAAALVLGATEIWSFDGRQRALAAAEGLKVGP